MQLISTIQCQRYTLALRLFDNPLTNENSEIISVDHVTNINRFFDVIRHENKEIDDVEITRFSINCSKKLSRSLNIVKHLRTS